MIEINIWKKILGSSGIFYYDLPLFQINGAYFCFEYENRHGDIKYKLILLNDDQLKVGRLIKKEPVSRHYILSLIFTETSSLKELIYDFY